MLATAVVTESQTTKAFDCQPSTSSTAHNALKLNWKEYSQTSP